jgi:hypothetical protein
MIQLGSGDRFGMCEWVILHGSGSKDVYPSAEMGILQDLNPS